jgi:hypothetical protein
MSDLSPLCASKRMSANGRVYEPSPTGTASWQLSMRGFEGLNSSCGRFAPNQSHCAAAATKQPVGQIFAFAVGQITFRTPAILSPRKGRWPSSRTLGWDAVDAAVSGVKCVRRAVSVSGQRHAGRTMLKRTVKSCGPDASVVGVKPAEGKSARPGADEPAIRRRRRQQSPILRGEREVSRKAIAQGMSECLR